MAKRKAHIDSRAYCALGVHAPVLGRRTKSSLAKIEIELRKVAADWGEIDGGFAEEAEQALETLRGWREELAERVAHAGREAGDWDE